MSYGLRYIGRQNLTQRNFANFIQQHKLSSEYLRQGEIFVPAMREEIRRVRESESFQVCRNLLYYIVFCVCPSNIQSVSFCFPAFPVESFEKNNLAVTFGWRLESLEHNLEFTSTHRCTT